MKVVLTYDMGESFVEELQTAFPELDFYPVYDEAEQVQEVADAEVVFGLMRRPVFLAAKELKWFHLSASASTRSCATYRNCARVTWR